MAECGLCRRETQRRSPAFIRITPVAESIRDLFGQSRTSIRLVCDACIKQGVTLIEASSFDLTPSGGEGARE